MYYVGVDIGGTNVKAGIIDETGKIVVKSSIPTDSDKDYKKITGDVAAQIRALADSAKIDWQEVAGVGIGCPGIITSETGVIDYTCNLGWRGVPLAAEFTARLDKPAFVSNDANVAALGEAMFGTGKDYRDVIFITLGTGVGGGVIIDNKLFEGYLSKGAELGHMVINVDGELCGCGRRGCMEAYCSATALIRDTKRAMQADKESAMWQYVGGDPEKVDGKTAFECSKKGDASAKRVIDAYIKYLGEGLSNFVNIFRPQAIILGGGVCAQGDYLVKPVQKYVDAHTYGEDLAPRTLILTATLGNDAGLVGAASLVMSRLKA